MKLKPTRITTSLAASLLLAASLTTIVRAADYPTTVLGFSPLGYWRFDETVASPALNKLANAGSLGSDSDGYAVLDVGKGEPGKVGNCIRLNNPGNTVGHCGSKVDVPWSAALNQTYPLTIEFWTKPNSLGGDGTGFAPISSLNPTWQGGGNRSGWLFYLNNNGRWEWRLGALSGYAGVLQSPNGAAVAGNWYHMVGTYDGSVMKLYINGNFISQTNPLTLPNWNLNAQMPLRIGGTCLQGDLSAATARPTIFGANGITGNRGYDGWMDEVAVYHSTLSAATVKAHFDAATTNLAGYGTQVAADGPLGYWRMEETAVTPPSAASLPIAANIGSVGSAADGTNNWGTLAAQTGSGYAGFGGTNKAAFFDGENGGIGLPDAAGLHFSGNITLMAWVKPLAKDFYRNIIAHGLDGGRAETFLRISMSDDGNTAGTSTNYYEVGVSDGTYYDSALVPVPDGDVGNWVFVAGTYDGSNWKIYRNGSLAGTFASAHGALDITNRWAIGSRNDPAPLDGSQDPNIFAAQGLRFSGSMDEPAIFGTALSASDINTLYNAAQVPPVITRAVLSPGTVFKGSSASFNVWAEGSPTLSYLWLSNGISTGVTTTNYTAASMAVGTPTIAVAVSNPYGSTTSSVTFSVVAAAPSFTLQPVPAARYSGRPFSFTVGVSGSTPMSLQWKTNGVAIPGANSATYSGTATPSVAFNYSCTASNEAGQLDSSSVALTVVTPPTGYGAAVIGDSPVAYYRLGETAGSVAYDYYGGQNGTFFATALGLTGFSPLDSDKSVAFNGANSFVGNINQLGFNSTGGNLHTNFTLEAWVNAQPGLADESTVIAKGIGSSGTSATEQFSIDVSTSPQTGSAAYHFFTRGGGNSIYEAFADVGPDGAWQHVVGVYDDLNVLGGGPTLYIYVNGSLRGTGATRPPGLRSSTSTVGIGSKRLGNDPNFAGTFNGGVDEVAAYSYALTYAQISNHYALAYGVSTSPTITTEPSSITVYEGFQAKLTVGAYGSQPLTYQWKKGGVDVIDGGTISGATTRQLVIDPVDLTDASNYSVTINNSVGPVTNSSTVTLKVIQAPTNAVNIPGMVLNLLFEGNLNDSSGRGNHGSGLHTTLTTTNSATPSATPAGNADFYFDTATGPDSFHGQFLHYHTATTNGGNGDVTNAYFVTLGNKPDLHFGSGVNFSVAYWVRFPPFNGVGDLGDLPMFCSAINSYGNTGFTFAPSYQLGSWSYSLNGLVQLYGGNYLLDDGVWHLMAHTFDRTGLAVTYMDGRQIDARADAAAGNVDSGNVVNIGQDPTGQYPEEGYYDVDAIRVWRKSLSQLEVVGMYLSDKLGFGVVDITPSIVSGPGAGQVTVTWQAGTLQQSTNVSGPYADVSGATSPYTTTASGAKFYRTRY